MNVRSQISMVFHLDKCIGCHTCSVACKNQWTDRRGIEYMWWNNVETKPGTGYPVSWEDQEQYQGGWRKDGDALKLRQGGRIASLSRIFYNPILPILDDYYEPFTYRYDDLFNAPAGKDQPTARPISLIDGQAHGDQGGPELGRRPLRLDRSTRRTTPTWKGSPPRSGPSCRASSGWSSSTCRASATTA